MNMQGHCGPKTCCCNNYNNSSPSNRYMRAEQNVVTSEDDECYSDVNTRMGNPPHSYPQGNAQCDNPYAGIDRPTLNTLNSLRHKACKFLRSESENSEDCSDAMSQQRYPNTDQYRGANLLRQASNLIDYNPQSEFLKKMKQQCQFLQNNQPNIFSTLDTCDEFMPHECQDCVGKAKRILTLGDQLRCSKFRSSPEQGAMLGCCCQNHLRMNEVNEIPMQARDPRGVQLYPQADCFSDFQRDSQRMSPQTISCKCCADQGNEDMNEKILQKSTKGEVGGKKKKKSEHKSRTKKQSKCKGRRKRKSGSSEKCESEEKFEPNLKKPHENSCERCWRFASPSRSPVNKPDQKYDPNFRRGHSCFDFKNERGDGDLEVAGRHVSPCKNLQPIVSREKVSSASQPKVPPSPTEVTSQRSHLSQQKAQSSSPRDRQSPDAAQRIQQKSQSMSKKKQCEQEVSFTKVKELVYNYVPSKSPEQSPPKSQPCGNGKTSPAQSKILQSDTGRKPRPKSYTGTFSNTDDIPSYALDRNDYCNICAKPKPEQPNAQFKESVRLSGRKPERLPMDTNALNVVTPKKSARMNLSPRASSTPKQGVKQKMFQTPDGKTDSQGNKCPRPQTPYPAKNLSFDLGSPDMDSTFYTEISTISAKNAYPLSPGNSLSPKSKARNGKSPKKEQTSPKKGSRQSSSALNFHETCPQGSGERMRTSDEPVKIPKYGPINEQYTGSHPIRDCWCPPRAPFVRKLINEEEEDNPTHLFCCHCHWEEILQDQQNEPMNCGKNPHLNEMNGRPHTYGGTTGRRQSPPKNLIRLTEEEELSCPYRAFQMEKRALNDTAWEEKYQQMKETCFRSPEQFQYRVSTKTENPFKPSEYVPTKYAVFYMTQNKQGEDGDVEVMVEELTQACPDATDSRTKDITEKMKRITQCPPDSMALRFQKGVSGSCKTPPSSRILYF